MALEEKIMELKESPVAETISTRMREFRECDDIFSEMCFCILTANASAKSGIKTQKEIGHKFGFMDEHELREYLRTSGCRFYRNKCSYILAAREKEFRPEIFSNGMEAREWLVKNIKGLGYKEASHFLRNIGFEDVAILDRHILNIMADNNLIAMPKTLTKKRYLDIEQELVKFAKKVDLSLGELDLYLWYLQTGKVLK